MSKKMRRAIVTTSVASAMACLFCGTAMLVNAAETGTAYVFIRDVADQGVRYEGVDAAVNTIKDGVATASIEQDGSYTVSFDLSKESAFETVDEISMLKLYINGTDKSNAATVTVNDLKINGDSVTLSGTPAAKLSGNDFYVDLCDTNGDELFNRTDYVNSIKTIAIDFTVSGWPTEETTTAETTTTTESGTTTSATTAVTTTTTSAPNVENAGTGDSSVAAVGAVMAAAAALSVLTVGRKRK